MQRLRRRGATGRDGLPTTPTIHCMARTDDPNSGPWAGELGRLDKLLGQIENVKGLPPDDPGKWDGLIFSVAMMRDILNNVVLDLRERFPAGPI